jgi:hypothetical protein
MGRKARLKPSRIVKASRGRFMKKVRIFCAIYLGVYAVSFIDYHERLNIETSCGLSFDINARVVVRSKLP